MDDHKTTGEAFGELLGLIEIRGMDPDEAIDLLCEGDYEKDTEREVYEELVEEHWSNE